MGCCFSSHPPTPLSPNALETNCLRDHGHTQAECAASVAAAVSGQLARKIHIQAPQSPHSKHIHAPGVVSSKRCHKDVTRTECAWLTAGSCAHSAATTSAERKQKAALNWPVVPAQTLRLLLLARESLVCRGPHILAASNAHNEIRERAKGQPYVHTMAVQQHRQEWMHDHYPSTRPNS